MRRLWLHVYFQAAKLSHFFLLISNAVFLPSYSFVFSSLQWSFHPDLSSFYRRKVVLAWISIPVTTTTSKMASLTKRIYSCVFLMSLRPNGRPRIESTLYNTLKSINILRATRGVRTGARVKQRAAMLSSQRIHTFITTHQRVQSAKYGAGHLATNCINIPKGTRITSKVPTFLITNACHVSNKVDELHGVVEMNNATVAIVTESWLTDSVSSTAVSIGQSFNVFRKDRPTPGGGVLAYVHSSIPTIRLENIEAVTKRFCGYFIRHLQDLSVA